jgi:hypothetical protein
MRKIIMLETVQDVIRVQKITLGMDAQLETKNKLPKFNKKIKMIFTPETAEQKVLFFDIANEPNYIVSKELRLLGKKIMEEMFILQELHIEINEPKKLVEDQKK